MQAHLDNALQIAHSTSKEASSIIGVTCHHHNGTRLQGVLSDGGRQVCPRCTCVAYNSIAFPTPTRGSMLMICIEKDAGSCMGQASAYDLLPPMCPRTALDFPCSQITRREKVSSIEITNGDFAGEITIVVARSMKVHGGSRRPLHKDNACVGQMGEVLSHKFIWTSHQQTNGSILEVGAEIAISLRKLGNASTAPRRSL